LDLKMPVMSGFDVLEWLKASRIEPKPKVLVLSGSNDHADQMRALALGAAEYLVKPITPEVLSQRISDELNSSGEGESAGATA
jgi:putative two-component system response regulator